MLGDAFGGAGAGAAKASDEETSALLAKAAMRLDEIGRTLSDWDVEYNGDGSCSRRDWRRVLPLACSRAI